MLDRAAAEASSVGQSTQVGCDERLETISFKKPFYPRKSKIRKFLSKTLENPDGSRLRSEIDIFYSKTYWLTQRPDPSDHLLNIKNLYDASVDAYNSHEYEIGWNNILEAHRVSYFLLDEDELAVAYLIIKNRGRKILNGWRLHAFERLLEKYKENPNTKILYGAAHVIGDAQESNYHKIHLARYQTNLIGLILLSLSIAFLFLMMTRQAGQTSSTVSGNDLASNTPNLLTLFLLGGMGACVSSLISFPKQGDLKIPDRVMTFVATFVRPVVGAVSAVAGAFFCLSGVVHMNVALLYVTAFAFGFSERLVTGVVTAVTKSENAKSVPDK